MPLHQHSAGTERGILQLWPGVALNFGGNDMRRRDLIVLAGHSAIAWPLSARAQRTAERALKKRPVIGVLSPFVEAESTFLSDVRSSLTDRGLHEGSEIAIEYRSAEG